MDEIYLRNRGQFLSHAQQECLFCDRVAEIEELRQHIFQTHNQTGPYPQPTARSSSVADGWLTSQSELTQRQESEDSWFSSIFLGLISTNLPHPLSKALSLSNARRFFLRVSWKVALMLGILAVILVMVIWQLTANLVSNAIAVFHSLANFISNAFERVFQPLANIASSATYISSD